MNRIGISILICLLLSFYHLPLYSKEKSIDGGVGQPSISQPQKKPSTPAPTIKKPDIPAKTVEPQAKPTPRQSVLPTDQADLVIRSFSCAPATLKKGATTTLRAVVFNSGTARAENFSVGFYLDGTMVAEKQKLSVAARKSVQIAAPYRPEQSGRLTIQVRADNTNTVKESNERNNTAETTLTVNEPLPTRQAKTPLSALPQAAPSLGELQQREVMAAVTPHPSAPADLAVGNLRYHDATSTPPPGTMTKAETGISFVVRNTGSVHIDPAQFRRSQAKIVVDQKPLPGYLRLEQLVSHGQIGKPGSQATAWIPVELQEKVPVSITINPNNAIFEVNKSNNSARAVLGSSTSAGSIHGSTAAKPHSLLQERRAQSIAEAAATGVAGDKRRAGPSPQKPARRFETMPLMTMEMSPRPAADAVPEALPMRLDQGIEVVEPHRGEVFSPGDRINVRYRFSRVVAAGGTIVFSAIRVGGDEEASLSSGNYSTGPTGRVRNLSFPLPADITDGQYFIKAHHQESGAIGWSDMFRIAAPGTIEVLEFTGTGEAIGDGGGFGGPGRPTLTLLAPRGGDHIREDVFEPRWRYHGPLEELSPHASWLLEFLDPDDGTTVRSARLSCNRPRDVPASGLQALPSRTCSGIYHDHSLRGDYRLRLSGAGLSDETAGTIHWGVDAHWPHIMIFNPTPNRGSFLFEDESIPVAFSFRPARSDIVIQLFHGDTPVHNHFVPRLSCGMLDDQDGQSDLCRYNIPPDGLIPDSNNYRIVVRSFSSHARAERGPFSIYESPFSETDETAIDFRLSDLRVNADGELQAYTSVARPPSDSRPTHRLAYMVAKGEDSTAYRRMERDVPAAGGWIDLGHIDSYATPTDKAFNERLLFSVVVNQPVEIIERTYVNNSISQRLAIRGAYVRTDLENSSGESYWNSSTDTLRYTIDDRRLAAVTAVNLKFWNWGYGPASGSVEVVQVIRTIPGELDTREERVPLGRKSIRLEPNPDLASTGATRIPLFGGGINFPRVGDGELLIRFAGDLNNYRHDDMLVVPFRARR